MSEGPKSWGRFNIPVSSPCGDIKRTEKTQRKTRYAFKRNSAPPPRST